MTCWSDLASDVLEHITNFLSLPDHHRFSAVCKHWRSIAKQKRHSPAPQLPWLVLREDYVTRKRIFYSLSEERHYALDIPELYGRYICGSSHGWLFAIDTKIMGILINPFTREFYELPPFPPYDVGDYIDRSRNFAPEKMQYKRISKAILSHDPKVRPDFTVMIMVGFKSTPAFWKPGDSSWLVVSYSGPRMEDVIYFEGQFYFVNVQNDLFVLDFEPDPKMTEILPYVGIGHPRMLALLVDCYLVDYFGVLLLVERLYQGFGKQHCKTYWFNVIALDLETNECLWSGVGDYALFLGRNSPVLIDPSHFSGCKNNSIYFTHINRSLTSEKFGCDNLGIFNMGDNTMTTFYPSEIFHSHVDSPIWFTPNPW